MRNARFVVIWGLLGLAGYVSTIQAASAAFTTYTLSIPSQRPDCLDYCTTGLCQYLVCSLTGCSIRTQPQIEHNAPDLVVSVYPEPGETPWIEAQVLFGQAVREAANTVVGVMTGQIVGGGGREQRRAKTNPTVGVHGGSLVFNEVSVIGNPAAGVARQLMSQFGYLCPSSISDQPP